MQVANHSHHYLSLREFDLMLGESFSSKFDRIRQEMAKKNAAAMAVTLLDEVAWLFNLRGSDIALNPGKQSLYFKDTSYPLPFL